MEELRCLVIIPTFNEKENIENIVRKVIGLDDVFHVLIVDDNSPDGTADIVIGLQSEFSRLHILQRAGKLGLGTAYIEGFKYGLANDFDFIFEMDADFSHNPKDLLRLLEACKKGGDVAVGSRYVSGGGLENWPLNRKLLSQTASLYVRLITGMGIKDPTAGFICYSKKVLKKLDLDSISFIGYAFQIEMKYAAYLNGFNVVEIPIIFKDRELGQSKMSPNIITEAIKGVILMRIKGLSGYYTIQ